MANGKYLLMVFQALPQTLQAAVQNTAHAV
jgi:hypothetical protein